MNITSNASGSYEFIDFKMIIIYLLRFIFLVTHFNIKGTHNWITFKLNGIAFIVLQSKHSFQMLNNCNRMNFNTGIYIHASFIQLNLISILTMHFIESVYTLSHAAQPTRAYTQFQKHMNDVVETLWIQNTMRYYKQMHFPHHNNISC